MGWGWAGRVVQGKKGRVGLVRVGLGRGGEGWLGWVGWGG